MEKRYQVFISSTFTDLKEERDHVFRTLMEMDCIPAGMELFPAIDDEQLLFIKKVIDDSDYYLIVIGGRYGTPSEEGISYTEMEFDYAVSKGLKVVALIHGAPDQIPAGKSEGEPAVRAKLDAFKDKVKTGRLVKFWTDGSEIPGLVSLSMNSTIKRYPAVGWVRATQAPSQEILAEINELRKEKEQSDRTIELLKQEISGAKEAAFEGIADIDSNFWISLKHIAYIEDEGLQTITTNVRSTWREIFVFISPFLIGDPSDRVVRTKLGEALFFKSALPGTFDSIDEQQFKTVAIQLSAYQLVSVVNEGGLRWHLTDKGHRLMMESRIVRKGDTGAEEVA